MTSIEDLSATNIALGSSMTALANEQSPRSSDNRKKQFSVASSNLEEDGPNRHTKLGSNLDEGLDKDVSKTDEFNRVLDIRTINLDKDIPDNSFESTNLMLNSFKKID